MGLTDKHGRAARVVVTDASYREGIAAIAAVTFDDGWAMRDGEELLCELIRSGSPAAAEQTALRRAIERVTTIGWTGVRFYADNNEAVRAVRSITLPSDCIVAWAPRDRVRAAHNLARRRLRHARRTKETT